VGLTRVFFRHGEMSSPSSPSPDKPTTVVVVVLWGEEYHVVAAVGGAWTRGSQSRAPSWAKEAAGDCPSGTQRESIVNTQRPLPGAPTVGVSDPGDPQPNRLMNFVSRAPVQMG
jgi:hypothetical protein